MRNIFGRRLLPERPPVELTDDSGRVILRIPADTMSVLAGALFPLLLEHGQVTLVFGYPRGTIAEPVSSPVSLTVKLN